MAHGFELTTDRSGRRPRRLLSDLLTWALVLLAWAPSPHPVLAALQSLVTPPGDAAASEEDDADADCADGKWSAPEAAHHGARRRSDEVHAHRSLDTALPATSPRPNSDVLPPTPSLLPLHNGCCAHLRC